jgi:hypothetical protein
MSSREIVTALRAFVKALKKRPDVEVLVARLGRKASAKALKTPLHPELDALHAVMNGAHIEWRFIDPPGGGCLHLPTREASAWLGDADHFMHFGRDTEALLLDAMQPEGSTWLVRSPDGARILFASAGQGERAIEPAASIEAYLRAAMDSGAAHWWPRCHRESDNLDYSTSEAAVDRFQAPPVAPSPFRAGVRVQPTVFPEVSRGVLQRVVEAPLDAPSPYEGARIGLVALDLGGEAWIPQRFLRVCKPRKVLDAYETLRSGSFDVQEALTELPVFLDELERAMGPATSSEDHPFGTISDNARRGAGMLATRSLPQAAELVLDVLEALDRSELRLTDKRTLTRTGTEVDPTEFKRNPEYHLSDVVAGLVGGLLLRALCTSASSGSPGNQLLDPAVVDRLDAMGAKLVEGLPHWARTTQERVQDLVAALRTERVHAWPRWQTQNSATKAKLGIAEGDLLYTTGR